MYTTDVAVIGAGQAGLAMGRCLSDRGIDHVVFERGEVGARWQSHAWDSLRLLTPNWLNGLPGSPYHGDDPDGFMRRNEFLARLQGYAASLSAPVLARTDVLSILRERDVFLVSTSRGSWRARTVVVATGQCDVPFVPAVAHSFSRRVLSLHSSQYRSPLGVPEGGVLVVGASASGVQIADELQRSGRKVTLAVGRHTRAPRTWRGRDIFWWMDRAGILVERTRDLPDADAAKRQPALQLAGRPDRSNVDLSTLQALGVRLTGRVTAAEGDRIAFSDDLPSSVTSAQARLERLLARIDAFAGFGRDSSHDESRPSTCRAKRRSAYPSTPRTSAPSCGQLAIAAPFPGSGFRARSGRMVTSRMWTASPLSRVSTHSGSACCASVIRISSGASARTR